MMKLLKVAGIGMMLMVLFYFAGCAGSTHKEFKPQATLVHLDYKKGAYIQKTAIVLGGAPGGVVGREVANLYLRTLIRTIHKENRRVRLIGENDSGFPDFLHELEKSSGARDIFKLAELSRAQGFQGLIRAVVLDIQPEARKTGVLWFRKMRYFISFGLTLDLYDPFTSAKLFSIVKQKTIKVSEEEYGAVREQYDAGLEKLNKAVVDAAEELGEAVAEALESQPWKATVTAVQNGRVFLVGGTQAGLKIGDRLDVFEARRTIKGPNGEMFIVPGYQVGKIRITALGENQAEASVDGQAQIQKGDIAVPVD